MREFINIVETASNGGLGPVREGYYRLFRGDSSKIDQFNVGETSLYSLFGHGIYLTDNKRVAGDYTTKGSTGGDVIYTLQGAKTKNDVLNSWLWKQAAKIDIDGKDHSGEIAYWSNNVPYSDGGDWSVVTNDLRKKEREQRFEYARQKWAQMSKDYEIRVKLDGSGSIQKKLKKSNGQIAVFDVPADYVAKVLHADAEISVKVLDELCYVLDRHNDKDTARDIRQFVKQQEWEDGERPTFRQVYTGITADSPFIHDEQAHTEFRDALKSLGYVGIEYVGGITMGGGYKHRAFVFWDEAVVNKYRVA